MGFRCPVCHKDFGSDREALNTHMEMCESFDIENVDLEEFGIKHAQQKVYDSTIKPLQDVIDRMIGGGQE